jgi:hypothetical protein
VARKILAQRQKEIKQKEQMQLQMQKTVDLDSQNDELECDFDERDSAFGSDSASEQSDDDAQFADNLDNPSLLTNSPKAQASGLFSGSNLFGIGSRSGSVEQNDDEEEDKDQEFEDDEEDEDENEGLPLPKLTDMTGGLEVGKKHKI